MTGAATAATEADRMVAIGGAVPLPDVAAVAMMRPVAKFSASIGAADVAGEAVANAVRAVTAPRSEAAVVALSQEVERMPAGAAAPPMLPPPPLGAAPELGLRVEAAR